MYKILMVVCIVFQIWTTPTMAATYPTSCGSAFTWKLLKIPSGTATPINSFSGSNFSLTGLSAGQYTVRDNSAMLPIGNNTFTVGTDGKLSGSITCSGYKFTVQVPIQECINANIGAACNWYTIFEPNYYPTKFNSSYWATNPILYNPSIPRCVAPAPSTLPVTTVMSGHISPRCMRKFTFVRAAGADPYNAQLIAGTAIELFPPN